MEKTDSFVRNIEQTCTSDIDSYQKFLDYFNIDKREFYEWGISNTIFPMGDKVELEWNDLKKRIFNNKIVYIRGYGRDAHGTDLYKNLYKRLFDNSFVEKDPTNNTYPRILIERITGRIRNKNIYNYQVSHIWGRTKNIFMFESPWNICYVPKIIDPLTGHESQGIWPSEYQEMFIAKARSLYSSFIAEYNEILMSLDIQNRLKEYISVLRLKEKVDDKTLERFYKDVSDELSNI